MLTFMTQFVNMRIGVIPITYKDKRPAFNLLPKDDNGHRSWEPYKTTLPTQWTLDEWCKHQINYGVICGWQNLTVIDFDDMEQYNSWLIWAMRQGGITRTISNIAFRVVTARGVHVYVRTMQKEKARKLKNVDIKSDGYVLGPGSVHPSGTVYTAARDNFNFPVINTLSDILPVSLLTTHTESKSGATPTPLVVGWDPWKIANNPHQRVSKGIVEKIHKSLYLEDFLSDLIPSGGNGRWYLTKCPLHDDHSPSMWVDMDNQICGCYAGCNSKSMDVINLFARLNGITNSEAISVLGERL